MKTDQLKKGIVLTGIALALIAGIGVASNEAVYAQGRDPNWSFSLQFGQGRGRGYYNDRYYVGRQAYSHQVRRGFRDGLDRGREDSRYRRSFNPNHSSHYRKGSAAYRDGFERGYAQGYRQSRGFGYRRW
ncbi:MAG: hypothetical protein HY650_15070 [Acidobacteria bacterium]|nr:hypothetical protein [Acidobacteriota bacterium]